MLKTIVRKGDDSKQLFLMRGISGSGKTTLAERLSASMRGVIFSTDAFFTDEYGGYNWNANLLGVAHKWNQKRAAEALDNSAACVIIDNTNLTVKEVKFYIEVAIKNDYTISVVEPTTPWARDVDILIEKNVHNVPREAIERMLGRMKPHHEFCSDLRSLIPNKGD